VREVIPIEVGSFVVAQTQLNVDSISETQRKEWASQRKHDLCEDKVDSDSDQEQPDILPSVVSKLPSFSLFCKTRHHKWFKTVKIDQRIDTSYVDDVLEFPPARSGGEMV